MANKNQKIEVKPQEQELVTISNWQDFNYKESIITKDVGHKKIMLSFITSR